MYFQIMLGFVLLYLCCGNCSKQAVTTINYHHGDLPLSYKYSSYIYPTEKTNNDNHLKNNHLRHAPAEDYKSLQYAPLPMYQKEKYTMFTNAIIPNKPDDYPTTSKENSKDHLEPRDRNSSNNYLNTNARFIIGYNIEKSRINKLRNENFDSRYQNDEHLTTTESIMEKKENITNTNNLQYSESSETLKTDLFRRFNLNYQKKPVRTYEVLFAMENSKIQPALNSFYNIRVPRININVARSYNIARSPYKALTYHYKNLQHKAFNIYEYHNKK